MDASQAQNPVRSVPTRPMEFDEWVEDVPKHFAANGDIVLSHVLMSLSSVFPDGENFFVRSVERVRDQIDDPKLQEDVEGFIGQEEMHGREHRVLNEHLAELGYPTRAIEKYIRKTLEWRERIQSTKFNLAVTAWIGEWTLVAVGLALHAAIAATFRYLRGAAGAASAVPREGVQRA